MPLFRASLRMAHDTTWPSRRKWSNTFYFNVANAAAAAAALVVGWVDHLRNAADETIFAYEVYATDLVPSTSNYVVQPIAPGSRRGTIAIGSRGEVYLPKTSVAVELLVPGSRPSRKFWRPGLREADVENGDTVDPDILLLINTAFEDFVTAASPGLVDPDTEQITAVGQFRLTTREFGRTAGADVPAPPVG